MTFKIITMYVMWVTGLSEPSRVTPSGFQATKRSPKATLCFQVGLFNGLFDYT